MPTAGLFNIAKFQRLILYLSPAGRIGLKYESVRNRSVYLLIDHMKNVDLSAALAADITFKPFHNLFDQLIGKSSRTTSVCLRNNTKR